MPLPAAVQYLRHGRTRQLSPHLLEEADLSQESRRRHVRVKEVHDGERKVFFRYDADKRLTAHYDEGERRIFPTEITKEDRGRRKIFLVTFLDTIYEVIFETYKEVITGVNHKERSKTGIQVYRWDIGL